MEKLVSYFFTNYHYRNQSKWFKIGLYTILLIHAANWICYYPLYFGDQSIVYQSAGTVPGIKNLAFLLYENNSSTLPVYFIAGVVLISLLSLLLRRGFLVTDFLLWFLVLNIQNKIYPTLTGGSFLLNQYLLFNCFLSFSTEIRTGIFSSLKVVLHNFASLAVIVQLCVAYFLAAVAKLEDFSWLHGTAISTVLFIDHFNMFSSFRYNATFEILYQVFNYVITAYQLLFALLIWYKPLKKPLLLFGIATHVYISLVMGLVMFGIIMILGYVFLWPQRDELR